MRNLNRDALRIIGGQLRTFPIPIMYQKTCRIRVHCRNSYKGTGIYIFIRHIGSKNTNVTKHRRKKIRKK